MRRPSFLRGAFFKAVGSIVLKGGVAWATYSLAFLSACQKIYETVGQSWPGLLLGPIAKWWMTIKGWELVAYILGIFAAGETFYAAHRIWRIGEGGVFSDSFEEMRAITLSLSTEVKFDGLFAFATWGVLLQRRCSPNSWGADIIQQAVFGYMFKGYEFNSDSVPLWRRLSRDPETENKPFLSDVISLCRKLELHGLIARDAGQDKMGMEEANYRLTEDGRRALVLARRIVKRSAEGIHLLQGPSAP